MVSFIPNIKKEDVMTGFEVIMSVAMFALATSLVFFLPFPNLIINSVLAFPVGSFVLLFSLSIWSQIVEEWSRGAGKT